MSLELLDFDHPEGQSDTNRLICMKFCLFYLQGNASSGTHPRTSSARPPSVTMAATCALGPRQKMASSMRWPSQTGEHFSDASCLRCLMNMNVA